MCGKAVSVHVISSRSVIQMIGSSSEASVLAQPSLRSEGIPGSSDGKAQGGLRKWQCSGP